MLVSTMTNKQLIQILKRFKPSASVVVVSPDGLTAPSITASLNESGEWLIQISPSVTPNTDYQMINRKEDK